MIPSNIANKAFFLYQIADILLATSIKAFAMIFSWLLIQVFHDSVDLGIYLFLSWVAQVIILLLGGKLGDSYDKKKIVKCCIIIALSLLFFSALFYGYMTIISLGCVLIITSAISGLVQPISISIIPQLFQKNELDRAFRYRGSINSLNTVSGPAISGLLIHQFGVHLALYVITSFLIIAFFIISMVKLRASTFTNAKVNAPSLSTTKSNMSSGIIMLFKIPTELNLSLISAFFNFVLTPLITFILPILILEVMGLSTFQLGITEALFGIGMLLSSLCIVNKTNTLIGKAFASFLGALILAAAILAISICTSIYTIHFYMFLAGVGLVMFNVNTTSIRCIATPESSRNSLESSFLFICVLSLPIGMLFFTYLNTYYSVQFVLFSMGIILIFASFMILICPNYLKIAKMQEQELTGYYGTLYPKAFNNPL